MEGDVVGPVATGKPAEEVTLTDCLIPYMFEQPVLLSLPGSDSFYLPVFTDVDALRTVMRRAAIGFVAIKKIDDGLEFMASLRGHHDILVAMDPWFTEEGRVRFLQIDPNRAEDEARGPEAADAAGQTGTSL